MAMRVLQPAIWLVLWVLILAACSPGAPTPTVAPIVPPTATRSVSAPATSKPAATTSANPVGSNACPTQAEVEQVLAAKVTPNISSDVGGQFCQYTAGPEGNVFGLVNIMIFIDPSDFKDLKAPGVQSVSGVGTDAYWLAAANKLSVLKGQTYFTVALQLNKSASLDTAKALALKVVAKLP